MWTDIFAEIRERRNRDDLRFFPFCVRERFARFRRRAIPLTSGIPFQSATASSTAKESDPSDVTNVDQRKDGKRYRGTVGCTKCKFHNNQRQQHQQPVEREIAAVVAASVTEQHETSECRLQVQRKERKKKGGKEIKLNSKSLRTREGVVSQTSHGLLSRESCLFLPPFPPPLPPFSRREKNRHARSNRSRDLQTISLTIMFPRRLRAFVGILFLCVVFLVGFAHIYYTQHVLQRAYFEKFR